MKLKVVLLAIIVLALGLCTVNSYAEENPNIINLQYRAHVQDEGWQNWRQNGELAGTTGKEKRIEAIELKSGNLPSGIVLKYRVHVQNEGWQSWKKDGELAGTTGQRKRIEAIEVKLENNQGYEVQYRAHVQDEGWQDWKKNGELAGTTGQSKRVEAIEIKIEPTNPPNIVYQVHVQDEGWQSWKKDGELAGTTGQGKRIEAIEIKLENNQGYNIKYRAHVQDEGWQSWKKDGELAGTTGQGKRIEAIEINIGKAESTPPENSEETIKIMYTTAESLNVRSGPGTNYEKIGILPKGSKVEVVEEINRWAKIKFNDGHAYVSTSYLSENPDIGSGQQPLPLPSPTPSYVDSPQNPGVIDQSQDIYQNKINVVKKNTNGLSGLAISTNEEFKINYQLYSNGTWLYGENGNEVNSGGSHVEGIRINLQEAPGDYHIFYRTKIENQGWQAWVKDGMISGELGNGKNIKDLEVKLIVSNDSNSMIKPTIAIDTGHNVSLSGATNGIYSESYLTKTIGEKVIYKLRSMGYNIIDTLPVGEYTQAQELAKRTQVAQINEVDKFISIHFNSGPNGANGSEVYYSADVGSSAMANNVLNNIVNDFGFRNRGIKDGDHLYVLRNTNMPAILVEGCFLDNIDMNKFIAKGNSSYDIMADAIIRGII